MDRHCFDLWGIAAIGKIFSSGGGLSLMESHAMSLACPVRTSLSSTSALK